MPESIKSRSGHAPTQFIHSVNVRVAGEQGERERESIADRWCERVLLKLKASVNSRKAGVPQFMSEHCWYFITSAQMTCSLYSEIHLAVVSSNHLTIKHHVHKNGKRWRNHSYFASWYKVQTYRNRRRKPRNSAIMNSLVFSQSIETGGLSQARLCSAVSCCPLVYCYAESRGGIKGRFRPYFKMWCWRLECLPNTVETLNWFPLDCLPLL